ncbi:MAG: hypothetical protein ACLF0G_16375, partial [Candidatus Brocadiia bacterium]
RFGGRGGQATGLPYPYQVDLAALAAAAPRTVPHGRLETLNGTTVVHVEGTPAQMGKAYGTLLRPLVQRVVRAVITEGVAAEIPTQLCPSPSTRRA